MNAPGGYACAPKLRLEGGQQRRRATHEHGQLAWVPVEDSDGTFRRQAPFVAGIDDVSVKLIVAVDDRVDLIGERRCTDRGVNPWLDELVKARMGADRARGRIRGQFGYGLCRGLAGSRPALLRRGEKNTKQHTRCLWWAPVMKSVIGEAGPAGHPIRPLKSSRRPA